MPWYVILLFVIYFGIATLGTYLLETQVDNELPLFFVILAFFFWPIVLVDMIVHDSKNRFYA